MSAIGRIAASAQAVDHAPPFAHMSALIAGGTGNIGRAIVHGLLMRGATVVVPSRSASKLDALYGAQEPDERARLIRIVGDISDERDAERIRAETLARTGRLDAVVASLGSFLAAPSLLAADRALLDRVLADYLVAHFVVARTFVPVFQSSGGSYLFINGVLAFAPMPGSGLVSVATAGQAMLAEAIIQETTNSRARVNELVVSIGVGWGSADETRRNGERVAGAVANILVDGAAGRRIHLDAEDHA
jgi:NAD(P)-dependent dehydrogenase (short-subunit alcohol dehydrogenase family)